jgi:hypothetical protein
MHPKNKHATQNSTFAPIVLFVYNRPKHALETLEALCKNELADQSILYIFSDGINVTASERTIADIMEVRTIIRSKQWCKEVVIKEAIQNKGLANSVIDGVTAVIARYGKVIVLEDDLIPAHYFLKYMNDALDLYQDSIEIFQISGYSFPVAEIKRENGSFFLPFTSTWGWATWKRAWDQIDFECADYTILKEDKKLAYRFNFNGAYNYKKMLFNQMESEKISSWGIRFYWNTFRHNALILFPDKSLILNKGWDSSGRHGDNYNIFPVQDWEDDYRIKYFPDKIIKNEKYTRLISRYIKRRTSLLTKVIYKFNYVLKHFLKR